MTDRELMQQALEALEEFCEHQTMLRPIEKRDALRERLAQPEQEPVAWANLHELTQHFNSVNCGTAYRLPDEGRSPLYTFPPQRKPLTEQKPVAWVELTDDEQLELARDSMGKTRHWLVAQVEARLKQKNILTNNEV